LFYFVLMDPALESAEICYFLLVVGFSGRSVVLEFPCYLFVFVLALFLFCSFVFCVCCFSFLSFVRFVFEAVGSACDKSCTSKQYKFLLLLLYLSHKYYFCSTLHHRAHLGSLIRIEPSIVHSPEPLDTTSSPRLYSLAL
jgi:hypothetical protein